MSPETSEELNTVLDVAFSYGCDFLERGQTLYAFAITMDKNGEVNRSGELSTNDKILDPEDLTQAHIITLKKEINQEIHKVAATGLDVKVQRFKGEGFIKAIEVHIEHIALDRAQVCYLPYILNADDTVTYGEIFSQQKDKVIF
jgi:hypothetical protein